MGMLLISIHTLSGGMKQRVTMAMAISTNRNYLLQMSQQGLDVVVQKQVMKTLKQFNKTSSVE